MTDYLDKLADSARNTIQSGYYDAPPKTQPSSWSLRQAILNCNRTPIISEIKFASPSRGTIRKIGDLELIANAMKEGGAIGISVLTEPHHFQGQLQFISRVHQQTDLPVLMKDFILDPVQITAAQQTGATAILLIHALFDRGYCTHTLDEMIAYAHRAQLEVLLEVHSPEEFRSAVTTAADMIGINNRDLRSLKVDIQVTQSILAKHSPLGKTIVSESGFDNPPDLVELRAQGVHAFLIGTSIMQAPDIITQVKQFVDVS